MLGSQKIQLQMSKDRQALNALLKKETTEEGDTTKIEALTTSLDQQETEYRAYVQAEEKMGLHTAPKTHLPGKEGDGERKEINKVLKQVELRHYVSKAIQGQPLMGAAAEFNQALKMPDTGQVEVPLLLLDPDIEKRADAVSSFQADTAELQEIAYLERIFAESLIAHLGISMHSVAAGEAFATVLTAGAAAETVGVSTQVDASPAAAITNTTLAPVRISAAYVVQIEDLARTEMIENRLRADLSMVMGDQMDNQTLNGDAQLQTAGGLIAGATQQNVSTATHLAGNSQFVNNRQLFINQVDGQYAASYGQLAAGLGPYYYNHLANTLSTHQEADVMSQLEAKSISFRSSRHVSTNAQPAVDKSLGLICLKRGAINAAIVAMWPSISLIRDIYTEAGKGQVRLTANGLWNFAVIRSANFKNLNRKA